MDVVQVFTKNSNQWKAKEITDDEAAAFAAALQQTGVAHPLSHTSYLINLASPDDATWKRSIDAFVVEMLRAERLGIAHVVLHPGACLDSGEEAGVRRVAAALDEAHRQLPKIAAKCLLETTAGQGSCLGWRFEHLAALLDATQSPDRLGVCFDTCHVFAAGYPLSEPAEYEATMAELDRLVGLDRIRAFHLNDSKKPLGSRVDRHEHIGRGCLGAEAFRNLLRDPRFKDVPMYLETPKGDVDDQTWDDVNLRTLRELASNAKLPKR
jgi:deoxyribonuclease-4